MDILYSCLQGLLAGGYVGVSLGPLSIWATAQWLRGRYGIVAGVLLGGTVGDALVAALFLFGIPYIAGLVPALEHVRSPLVQGTVLIGGGFLGFYLLSRMKREIKHAEFRAETPKRAFLVALIYNATNGDTFLALFAMLAFAGIGDGMTNVVRFAAFVPASFLTFWLTIRIFVWFGAFTGERLIERIMCWMCWFSIGAGILRIVQEYI